MNQEYGQNYEDISATTIPYWDERCGEYFFNIKELEEKFNLFLSKIESTLFVVSWGVVDCF